MKLRFLYFTKIFETPVAICLFARCNIPGYIFPVAESSVTFIVHTQWRSLKHHISVFFIVTHSPQCIAYKRPALTVGMLLLYCVLRYLSLLSCSASTCFWMSLCLRHVVDSPSSLLFFCLFCICFPHTLCVVLRLSTGNL